jgi:transglutaminase-like putative cysteine protease
VKLALLAFGFAFAAGAQAPPAWLLDAARETTPAYPSHVDHAVLFTEETLSVDESGRRTMRDRGAIRILHSGGAQLSAARYYNARSGRIREFRAWLLPPNGKPISIPRNRIVDRSVASQNDVDEGRIREAACDPSAPPGSVFAWEIVEEESTIFTTYSHAFQGRLPAKLSRFVLTLPAGWESRGHVLNHPALEPRTEGPSQVWELRALPPLDHEPWSPHWSSLAPRLALTYWPPTGANPALRPMNGWPAVAQWLHSLTDPAHQITPEIQAKAAEVTASASSPWDRLLALTRFVQQVTYVSIQLNLNRGGGYTPNPAPLILRRNYGDCKDKSALLRALLTAAGFDAWTVAVYSGDRDYVRPEWPSPLQFNHVIVAIRVPDSIDAPTVLNHPALGRLLIFDPTDSFTPLGGLDDDQQGSHALLIHPEHGGLFPLPLAPPSENRVERSVQATLAPDGLVNARLVTRYHGQSGSYWRSILAREAESERKKRIERSLARRAGGVRVARLDFAPPAPRAPLESTVEFESPSLAQLMQNRLMTVAPGHFVPAIEFAISTRERSLPVLLPDVVRADEVHLRLPTGFTIDEMPSPVALQAPFGRFEASWEPSPEGLIFRQRLEINRTLAPASDYPTARTFFEQAAGAQNAAVVLLRQSTP